MRLARENTSWGYVRIVGELRKLGIDVSATLVRNVLADAGVPPAPQRDRLSWRSFLRQHGESILACDFLTVDTVWLRRLYVLVFLSIGSRRIEYVACTSNPDRRWMLQQARNLLMDLDDRERQVRFLIHDRDSEVLGAPSTPSSPSEKHQGHPHAGPGAERERARRALGRQRPPRVPRPAPDPRPPPARARPPRLRPPLQPRSRPHRALDLQAARPDRRAAARGDPPVPTRPPCTDATSSAASSTNTNSPPRDDRVSAPHGIDRPKSSDDLFSTKLCVPSRFRL